MKTRLFLLAVICILFTKPAFSQQIDCGSAALQLQTYVNQVNDGYRYEVNVLIPSQRCPDYWNGYPVNPQLVNNCRQQMYYYLNQWYGQQCNYVNAWYYQIVANCGGGQRTTKPAPPKSNDTEPVEEIDTNEIESLTAGVDENKTVKIRIPETAAAYRPKKQDGSGY